MEENRRRFPAWAAVVLAFVFGIAAGFWFSGMLAGGEMRAVIYTVPPVQREGRTGLAVSPATVVAGSRTTLVVTNLADFPTPIVVAEVDAGGNEKIVYRSERPLQPGEGVKLENLVVRKGVKEVRVTADVNPGGEKLGLTAVFVVKVI